jgi:hypothetical protein
MARVESKCDFVIPFSVHHHNASCHRSTPETVNYLHSMKIAVISPTIIRWLLMLPKSSSTFINYSLMEAKGKFACQMTIREISFLHDGTFRRILRNLSHFLPSMVCQSIPLAATNFYLWSVIFGLLHFLPGNIVNIGKRHKNVIKF